MEPHSLYRPPSVERMSPGQQPSSPHVKGSQRVVTLAQHISVSLVTLHLSRYMVFITFAINESLLKQEVITKDYTRQSQQQSYHGSPVLDLTRPPSASQLPPSSQEGVPGGRYSDSLGGERNRDR